MVEEAPANAIPRSPAKWRPVRSAAISFAAFTLSGIV
jgi:hypothetical protein